MSGHRPVGPDESAVTRIEREEFERGHVPPGEPPVEPRDAATIVLARDRSPCLEVLLLQRPHTSRFAAGAWVFPGGVLERGDSDPRLAERFPVIPAGAELPLFAAALREAFEETGYLPEDIERPAADASSGEPARGSAPARLRSEVRADLLSDRIELYEALERLAAQFGSLHAAYTARWITPVQLGRRYDTRFFLAEHDGQDPELTAEHSGFGWETPAGALARFRAGELPMLFPTWKTLEGLVRFERLADALDHFSRTRVEPYLAKLDMRGDRIRPLMPGDPGYDEV